MREYLTEEEVINLIKLLQTRENKRALTQVVNNYEDLVRDKSYRFYLATGKRIEYEDLVQEGFMALIKAIEKFDTDKDTKFLTFAFHYISGYHNRLLEKSNTVKIPTRDFWILSKVNKRKVELGIGYTDAIPKSRLS